MIYAFLVLLVASNVTRTNSNFEWLGFWGAGQPVKDDIVYVHASAEGMIDGRLERREFVRGYRPIEIAGKQRTAIAWTTAGSVVAIIEMVRDGKLPAHGFLKQEDIPLDIFLSMQTGSLYAS